MLKATHFSAAISGFIVVVFMGVGELLGGKAEIKTFDPNAASESSTYITAKD